MSDDPALMPLLITTANALRTGAPIGEEQLRVAMAHFKALSELCARSGPAFANANRDAIGLHNRAVQRMRETMVERQARERRAAEAMDGLTELPVI